MADAKSMMAMDAGELLEAGVKLLRVPRPGALPDFQEVAFRFFGRMADVDAMESFAKLCLAQESSGGWAGFDPLEYAMRFCGARMDSFMVKLATYVEASHEAAVARSTWPGRAPYAASEMSRFESALGECLAVRWRRFPGKKASDIAELASLPDPPAAFKAVAERSAIEAHVPRAVAAQPKKASL